MSEPVSDVNGYGLGSARPAAGIVGRLYYATDTSVVSRDNGSTWDDLILIPRLSAAPSGPVEGQSYYDTTLHTIRTWNGSAWTAPLYADA
jgi:hypothetical protein